MFNEKKATALATFFLGHEENQTMSYLKLIKLLYLADREHLDKHDTSITCDTYVCMKLGPVLSMTYMLIKRNEEKEAGRDDVWDKYISTKKYDVTSEGLLNALSTKEQQSAQAVWDKHGTKTEWELVEFTHKECPEWEDPAPLAVKELPLQRLLQVLNKEQQTIYSILAENTVF